MAVVTGDDIADLPLMPIGSTPAVQSAVCDALARLGVTHVDMPCTPERVWEAIAAARG